MTNDVEEKGNLFLEQNNDLPKLDTQRIMGEDEVSSLHLAEKIGQEHRLTALSFTRHYGTKQNSA